MNSGIAKGGRRKKERQRKGDRVRKNLAILLEGRNRVTESTGRKRGRRGTRERGVEQERERREGRKEREREGGR